MTTQMIWKPALALRCLVAVGLSVSLGAKVEAAYVFTNVTDFTTSAPIGVFNFFDAPGISGSTAVFEGGYDDGLNSGVGIFTGSGGALTTIAKTGDAAPSPPGGTITNISGRPSISGNTAVTIIFFSGGGHGIVTGSGGALTTIVKTGDAAPPGGTFSDFANPEISGGTVGLWGIYNGTDRGVFTGSGGALTTLTQTGEPAPPGGNFTLIFDNPAISGSNVAFVGQYPTGHGVFVDDGTTLTTIAKTGDTAPTGAFTAVESPTISGSTVAFSGDYPGGQGVFSGNGGSLTTIAATGDAAPLGTFNFFNTPSIGGSSVAFLGQYSDGMTTNHGIFVGDGGPLTTVIKQGDSLFGSTVDGVGFGQFGFDRAGNGNVAFLYALADGRVGIAVAAIPEPASLALIGLAAMGMSGTARRRHRAPSRVESTGGGEKGSELFN